VGLAVFEQVGENVAEHVAAVADSHGQELLREPVGGGRVEPRLAVEDVEPDGMAWFRSIPGPSRCPEHAITGLVSALNVARLSRRTHLSGEALSRRPHSGSERPEV